MVKIYFFDKIYDCSSINILK